MLKEKSQGMKLRNGFIFNRRPLVDPFRIVIVVGSLVFSFFFFLFGGGRGCGLGFATHASYCYILHDSP